jgi:CDP-glucose 4,6-dehydratase
MNALSEDGWQPDPSFWSGRAVAVTGATGFVGSHLVGMLVDLGAEVAVLIRDEVPVTPIRGHWQNRVAVVRGTVEELSEVERLLGEYEVTTVFHLAAQGRPNTTSDRPLSAFQANISGTWNLLEAARRSTKVAQLVVASSDDVYGGPTKPAFDEDLPLRTLDSYAASRACADLLARSFAKSYGVPIIVSRCGQSFGPGDLDWRGLIPGTIRALIEGRPPVVNRPANLTRDYLYVLDAARCHLLLAEHLAEDPTLSGEAFNFSTEQPLSVIELIEMLQIVSGTKLDAEVQVASAEQFERRGQSATKARQRLGWSPGHTIEEAMILTMRWYRDYLRNPEAVRLS